MVASVPSGAASGRPGVVDADGKAALAPERLRVVPGRAVPAPGSFELGRSSVRPRRALFDARREPRLRYRFRSDRRLDLAVTVVRARSGEVVRRWVERRASPFHRHGRRWNGLTRSGRAAPDGKYKLRVGRPGRRGQRAGKLRFHGHAFPVRGPHSDRGAAGEFGAPRSGGRTHEGFDVVADCGTRLAAARGGRVQRRDFHPSLYGSYVVIDGRKTRRDYMYSHLRSARVREGERVRTREAIGSVGDTGNARSVGCHLHFEIWSRGWRRGSPIDPEPELRDWDRWS